MSTVNISLPYEQVKLVDQFVKRYGFANRSEFIRSIIRLLTRHPDMVDSAATFPFVAPKERSVRTITSDFAESGKYTEMFLKDLKEGLSTSDYFNK